MRRLTTARRKAVNDLLLILITAPMLMPRLLLASGGPDVPVDQARVLLEAIHCDDTRAVQAALKAGANPNTRDELGSTALMHASAYASVACMRSLIAAGADVNAASAAGFTPLMWSASDPAKLRLLLSHHANVQARSKDGNTALILARQNGFTEAEPVLLAAGASDEDGMGRISRLALRQNRDLFLQIRTHGFEPMHALKLSGPMFNAVYVSGGVVEPLRAMLDAGVDPNVSVSIRTLELPALAFAAYFQNLEQLRELLNRGANPNTKGSRGLTPLMAACVSEFQNPAVIETLLAKGADLDARDELGRTALDWALLQGETAVVQKLRAAGAHTMAPPVPAPTAIGLPRSPRAAIEKALTLLQPAGSTFFKQSDGCISCHHNSLPGIAVTRALNKDLAANRDLASHHIRAAMATWRPMQENMAVGASSVPGLLANVSFEMTAMAERGFARNFVTDAAALALLRLQRSDGSWAIADVRPPLGGDILWTALTIRALQAYAPPALRAQRDAAIHRATNYLLEVAPRTTQDQAFILLGLHWAGGPASSLAKHHRQLLGLQREDGGWATLPTLSSDAYATGEALYALELTGTKAGTPNYRLGVDYLLRTQLPDGSWFVRSRALSFQPYQETGFPHDRSQFISAAATSWAVIALTAAVEPPLKGKNPPVGLTAASNETLAAKRKDIKHEQPPF
jgi:ankyrin repeat protein